MRSGLFLPIFDELADPMIVSRLSAEAEEAGKDGTEPYDFVATLPPGSDPTPYAAVGGTWWLVEFPWDAVSVEQVRRVIRDGPATA